MVGSALVATMCPRGWTNCYPWVFLRLHLCKVPSNSISMWLLGKPSSSPPSGDKVLYQEFHHLRLVVSSEHFSSVWGLWPRVQNRKTLCPLRSWTSRADFTHSPKGKSGLKGEEVPALLGSDSASGMGIWACSLQPGTLCLQNSQSFGGPLSQGRSASLSSLVYPS